MKQISTNDESGLLDSNTYARAALIKAIILPVLAMQLSFYCVRNKVLDPHILTEMPADVAQSALSDINKALGLLGIRSVPINEMEQYWSQAVEAQAAYYAKAREMYPA